MDKLNKLVVAVAAAFLLLSVVNGDAGAGAGAGDETSKIPTSSIIDAARRFFSLSTVSNSWFLTPKPNLDFRVGSNGGVEASSKVKDAVAKSLDKSKTSIQDSAKSAANTLKHKLKLPHHHLHQPEL